MDAKTNKQHSTLIKSMNKDNAISKFVSYSTISAPKTHPDLPGYKSDNKYDSGYESPLFLFRSTLECINDILEPELEARPLDFEYEHEGTHDSRILADLLLNLSTNIFSTYMQLRPELSESIALERFTNLIAEAFSQGVDFVRETLDRCSRLDENTSRYIDQAYEQLLEGLEEFYESFGYSSGEETHDLSTMTFDEDVFIDEDMIQLNY